MASPDQNSYTKASQENAVAQAKSAKAKTPVAFVSSLLSSSYIFPSGKRAHFVGGRYVTDIQYEIDHMREEIALGHPNFTESTEVVELIEPMEVLKKRFIEEFLAEQAKKTDGTGNAGTSEVQKLNPANSTTISQGAAGSISSAGNANSTTAPAPK